MKIVFVLGSMGRGGAEKVISLLSRHYAEKGWETQIILLLKNTVQYDLHESTKIVDLSGSTNSRIKRLPYWLKSVRSYIKKESPDVILSFAARINIIVQTACFGLKKKIVVSERNDPKSDGRGIVTRILTNLLYPKAKGVVFQTKRAASYFGKLKNAEIIPNPICVLEYAENIGEKRIVTAGRLTPQKNQKLLISAFAEVGKKHPEYILEIYGEGELKESLENQISELGIENKVFLMGNVKNIHERIKNAQIFVLSSDYEGLSNALLEAMMMGHACVSTNCAGSDEYIQSGENGILVPVGDKEQLTRAMLELIENDDLRMKVSANARKSVSVLQADNIIENWENILEG